MNRLSRRNPFEEMFNFQRDIDRLFTRFWNDAPSRPQAAEWSSGFQVSATDDGWRIEVPLAGIDPAHVVLEAAGNTVSIRAEEPAPSQGGKQENVVRFDQTISVPPFLDVEKMVARNRHGMLELTIPLKESVKPRRVQIQSGADQKQLTTV